MIYYPSLLHRTAGLVIRLEFLCIGWLVLSSADAAVGDADTAYTTAEQAYQSAHYDDAVAQLRALLDTHPECARCAHLLGKSYGRLAEHANWFDALDLARKTRRALERALALAPNDRDVIEDLIRYYNEAPTFLGGGAAKARALEQRLAELAKHDPR